MLGTMMEFLSGRVCLAGAVALAAALPRRPGMERLPSTGSDELLGTMMEFLSGRVCLAGAVALAAALPRRPGREKPSKMDARGRATPSSSSSARAWGDARASRSWLGLRLGLASG